MKKKKEKKNGNKKKKKTLLRHRLVRQSDSIVRWKVYDGGSLRGVGPRHLGSFGLMLLGGRVQYPMVLKRWHMMVLACVRELGALWTMWGPS